MSKRQNNEKGVTLIMLVITIIVILILATASINAIGGDNGILRRTTEMEEKNANKTQAEDAELNALLEEYSNSMTEQFDKEASSIDVVPKTTDGMIPVKWNGTNWVKTTKDDTEWFNYNTRQWANVVLSDATFTNDILDETKQYSMLVWIPRYAYKITSGWHQDSEQLADVGGAGTISVVFIDTNNRDKNSKKYNKSYAVVTANSETTHAMSDYVVHPAFTFGTSELEGFWVGKFESSNTAGVTGYDSDTTYTLQIKSDVTSWRSIQLSDIYTVCREMNAADNVYGLNSDDNIVDPHMLKNIEWGAIAYLSKSQYGNPEEIWNNSNSSALTGQAGSNVDAADESETDSYATNNGPKASTTGNVYGVYDMSGGAWEFVAAYVNNEYIKEETENSVYTYGANLINAENKYKDVYTVGETETQENNYMANSSRYGDAMYEVSSNGEHNPAGWYQDCSYFAFSNAPFVLRGDFCSNTTNAGVFCFGSSAGVASAYDSFRVGMIVL